MSELPPPCHRSTMLLGGALFDGMIVLVLVMTVVGAIVGGVIFGTTGAIFGAALIMGLALFAGAGGFF